MIQYRKFAKELKDLAIPRRRKVEITDLKNVKVLQALEKSHQPLPKNVKKEVIVEMIVDDEMLQKLQELRKNKSALPDGITLYDFTVDKERFQQKRTAYFLRAELTDDEIDMAIRLKNTKNLAVAAKNLKCLFIVSIMALCLGIIAFIIWVNAL